MPYNNTAIPPSDEITGSASLPLARVKRILQVDEEIGQCSANAAFAITVATELFIRYLAEQALNVVRSERKPRRNIQYKDLANAVSRIDNLEFLSDVIPRTSTYKEYKEKKARATRPGGALPNGQMTLDGSRRLLPQPVEMQETDDRNYHDAAPGDEQGDSEIIDHPLRNNMNGDFTSNRHECYEEEMAPDLEDVEMG